MNCLIVGAGRMGKAIKHLLYFSSSYETMLVDKLEDVPSLYSPNIVVACVPYFACPEIAEYAVDEGAAYFDLTEDIETREEIRKIASQCSRLPFVTSCGLAPGYVNVLAGKLAARLSNPIKEVVMRCGALPQDEKVGYRISWSADGLAREYVAPCEVRMGGDLISAPALTGYERLSLNPNWPDFEAFFTSGGAGTCPTTIDAELVSYKSLRYVDHLKTIPSVITAYSLEQRFGILRPSELDVVYINVFASDVAGNQLVHSERITPQHGLTAIQYATAKGAIDIINETIQSQLTGFIRPEQLYYGRG